MKTTQIPRFSHADILCVKNVSCHGWRRIAKRQNVHWHCALSQYCLLQRNVRVTFPHWWMLCRLTMWKRWKQKTKRFSVPEKCAASARIVQRQHFFVFSVTPSYAAHVLNVTPICHLLLITWLKSWAPWPQSSWLRTVLFHAITTRKKRLSCTARVMKNWFACFVLHLPTRNALVLKQLLFQQQHGERSWRSRISDGGKRKLPSRLRYSSTETGINGRDWCTYCLPYSACMYNIVCTYTVDLCCLWLWTSNNNTNYASLVFPSR